MKFEDVIEEVCNDKRTKKIPILFIVQIVTVIMDSFRLEKR